MEGPTMIEAPELDPAAPRRDDPRPSRFAPFAAGLVAGAVALAVGSLLAALLDVVSPINAVGAEFIDRVPKWLKTLAIDLFGTNDKTALRVGIVVILAAVAAWFGRVAHRRLSGGIIGFSLFGLIGLAAALRRPGQPGSAAIPSVIGAVAGIAVLVVLIGRLARPAQIPGSSQVPLGWDRRRFLATAGAGTVTAAVAYGAAKAIGDRRLDDVRNSAPDTLPPAAETGSAAAPSTAPPAAGQAGGGAGEVVNPATPFITPNGDFYRIDTALSFPRVDVGSWKVRIGGMVDRPFELTYDELIRRPLVERTITIACVSNEVGGDLIGNAVWKGVLLKPLLEEAGIQAGAEQIYSRSLDGWTCGFPVGVGIDGRDAMIAVAMNGEPLPLEHGFPARLIVPGVYGYVSATKWLDEIVLTTWDAEQGYWIPRGWAREAPIKTQSRIDVPRRRDKLAAGTVAVAGVAWAQQRGIAKVEVGIDGVWAEARLGADGTDDTWRQWVYEWEATPGKHTIQVRATDNSGVTQTEEVARVDPDGATGWHTRTVTVDG